jgi:steroid 5-alpha reductase family enzyme
MRKTITFLMVILGFALQIVSYFFLAAPIGVPSVEVSSNPRMEYAPVLFIVGVGAVFLAAVVYELLPDKQ